MKNKYETHVLPNLEKIEEWARSGATAKEIASKLNIAYSTFRGYLDNAEKGDERYSALSAAFVRACTGTCAGACAGADGDVEAALYKNAIGYNAKVLKHYKVKEVIYNDEGKRIGEKEKLEEVYDEVHVPANVSAQQFWLTNRSADRWKYKPEAVSEESDEGGVVIMSPVMDTPKPPSEVERGK